MSDENLDNGNNERVYDYENEEPSVVVEATELHDLTIEQVLQQSVPLDRTTRVCLRFADFTPDEFFSKYVGYITRRTDDINYTTVVANMAIHGLALLSFECQDAISRLQAVDDDNVIVRRKQFRKWHKKTKPAVDFKICSMKAWCDPETSDRIGVLAKLFNLPTSQMMTGVLLLSLVTSTTIPKEELKPLVEESTDFVAALYNYTKHIEDIQY